LNRKMILLSSKKLEKALAYDLLDEWDKSKYLVFTVVFQALAYVPIGLIRPYSGIKPSSTNQGFSSASSILSVLIVFCCIKRCFNTNRGIDNLNFIERYTILFVPITIRIFLFLLLIFMLLIILFNSIRSQYPNIYGYFSIPLSIVSPAIILIYYHMFHNSLKRFGFELANRSDEVIVLKHTCILAVVSLVLAIFSLALDIKFQIPITSISAIICGHLARRKIRKDENLTGSGVAIAGLIIGYIHFILAIDRLFHHI